MARYTGPIQKKLRSLGLETFGVYGTRKEKRANQGFVRRRRISNYGLQLREKQKAKFLYGILEKQFRNYYEKALDCCTTLDKFGSGEFGNHCFV